MRALVAPLISEGVDATVSKPVREAVSAIEGLTETKDRVNYKDVASILEIDKGSARRRVLKAISAGYVVNEQPKRSQPADLKLADPMPDDSESLPSVQRLHDCMQYWGDIDPPLPEEDFDEA